MKKSIVLGLMAILMPLSVFAHGDKVGVTQHAIETVLEKFKKEEATQVEKFLGVKAWPDGQKVQVKVYLPNSTFIQYGCSEHEMNGEEMVMCDKAQ